MSLSKHINDLEKNKFALGDDDKIYMQTTDGTTPAQAEIIDNRSVQDSHINDLEKRKFAVINGKTYVRTLGLENGGGTQPTNESFSKVVNGPIDLNTGDAVYVVGVNDVVKATSNNTPQPIVGIIIDRNEEVSQHSYNMLLSGVFNLNIPYGELWLSELGVIGNIKPVSGTRQRLGYSFGDGIIFFAPELQRSFVRL